MTVEVVPDPLIEQHNADYTVTCGNKANEVLLKFANTSTAPKRRRILTCMTILMAQNSLAPDSPKWKKYVPRYTLRTIFVLVTLLCVWLGCQISRANRQRKAVQWVSENSGWVVYYYQRKDENSITDPKPPYPRWLVKALGIDFFCDVKEVHLRGADVTDISPLSTLTRMEEAYLQETRVVDLMPLENLSCLKRLEIFKTPVQDLRPLARLSKLDSLNIYNTPVQDLTPLSKLKNLGYLAISGTQVRDLSPLRKLSSLQMLVANGTPVADVTPLMNVKSLQTVALEDTQVSEEQVMKLRKTLPRASILWGKTPTGFPKPP